MISGPSGTLPRPLGRFDVASLSGHRPVLSIRGGGLLPQLSRSQLIALARTGQAETAPSQGGPGPVRVLAETFPGYGTIYATTSLDDVTQTVGQLELILIIGSAVAGVIAAGGVAWVMRRGLRPVEVMAGQADKINAGDLTDRVSPHDPRTEIGRLGAALNGMLARIATSWPNERPARTRPAGSSPTPATNCAPRSPRCAPTPSCTSRARCFAVTRSTRRCAGSPWKPSGWAGWWTTCSGWPGSISSPASNREPVDLGALATECVQRARTASPDRTWRLQRHRWPGGHR